MARPRGDSKRHAILLATAKVFAERGPALPPRRYL